MLVDFFEKQGNTLFRWRSFIPVIFIVWALYLYAGMQKDAAFAADHLWWVEWLSLLLFTLGFMIRWVAVAQSGENTSGRNTKGQAADSINTLGLYSVVRHPLYVGNFFMWLSLCIYVPSTWFILVFTLCFILFYERIIVAEEQYLFNKFGSDYSEYAAKTPAIIPRFDAFRKGHWYKTFWQVLYREKNGLLAYALLVTVFKGIQIYYSDQVFWAMEWPYFLLAFSAALYLVLKVFRRVIFS